MDLFSGVTTDNLFVTSLQQQAQLDAQPAHFPRRTVTAEDGSERVFHAIPIEQAMNAVVREAADHLPARPNSKEAGS